MKTLRWLQRLIICWVWGHEFGYWWGSETGEYYKECDTCYRRWRSDRNQGWVECH